VTDLQTQIAAHIGQAMAPPRASADGVNSVMIRHWCLALDDRNKRYAPGPEQVAPPAMLQAWCMREFDPQPEGGPAAHIDELLAAGGYTAVVATNCEQRYVRDLRPGDVPVESRLLESVSGEKQTALGPGFFLTVASTYTVGGELVATMRFRTLRYQPQMAAVAAVATSDARRPRPAINEDNAYFFEGAARGELLGRRCTNCGHRQHPPLPLCPVCASTSWELQPMASTGEVYTFTVTHHPKLAGFTLPLVVALVELADGHRLVTNLVDVDPADVFVGMAVEVDLVAVDDELTLPLCRPSAHHLSPETQP
jgi:uncharacterized OB-fold protein